MPRGRLIAISGGEGSGKTSVVTFLRTRYPHFVYTREPGGTRVGEMIRKLLLYEREFEPRASTELMLFLAARAEHVAALVEPALARGETVVTDRYWPDSYAYQWFAGMDRTDPTAFLRMTEPLGFPMPDLWIWLDVNPLVGLSRRRGSGDVNRIDAKDVAFHRKVHEGFRMLFDSGVLPTARRVETSTPLDAVNASVEAAVAELVGSAVV